MNDGIFLFRIFLSKLNMSHPIFHTMKEDGCHGIMISRFVVRLKFILNCCSLSGLTWGCFYSVPYWLGSDTILVLVVFWIAKCLLSVGFGRHAVSPILLFFLFFKLFLFYSFFLTWRNECRGSIAPCIQPSLPCSNGCLQLYIKNYFTGIFAVYETGLRWSPRPTLPTWLRPSHFDLI